MNILYRLVAKIFNPIFFSERMVKFSYVVNDEMKVMFNKDVKYFNSDEFKNQNRLLYMLDLLKAVFTVFKVLIITPVEKRKMGSMVFTKSFLVVFILTFTTMILIRLV